MGKPDSHPGLSDPNTQDPNHHSTWAGVKRRKNVSHMSSPHCLFPQTRICPSCGVNFPPFLPSPRSLTDPAYALDPSLFLSTSVPHVRPRAALADEKLWAESFFGLLHRENKVPGRVGTWATGQCLKRRRLPLKLQNCQLGRNLGGFFLVWLYHFLS